MYVKGVGPARGAMLEAKGLHVVEDLLTYAPFRYEDRSNVKPIRDLAPGEMATVLAEVTLHEDSGFPRQTRWDFSSPLHRRLARTCSPASGSTAHTWPMCSRPGRKRVAVRQGRVRFLYRAPGDDASRVRNPLRATTTATLLHTGRIVPIYEAAGKVTTRALRTLIDRILESIAPITDDPLPEHIRTLLKLPDLWSAIRELHFPPPDSDLATAQRVPFRRRSSG